MLNNGAKRCPKCQNIYPISDKTCPSCFKDDDSVQTEEYNHDEASHKIQTGQYLDTNGGKDEDTREETIYSALVRLVTIFQDEGATFKDCHDYLQKRHGEKFHEIKPMLTKAWKEGTEELKIQDKSAFVNKFTSTMGSAHKDSLHKYSNKLAIVASRRFKDGKQFTDWASEMTERFGKNVQPFLREAWEKGTGTKLSFINRLSEKKTRLCRFLTPSVAGRCFAVLVLFLALSEEHDEDYYTLVRFVICAVCVFSAHIAFGLKKTSWLWVFGLMAAFFNPFIPLHLEQDTWSFLNVITGILLLISIRYIREV